MTEDQFNEIVAFARSKSLGDRHCRVIGVLIHGRSNKAVGDELGLTTPTIANYVSEILVAFGCESRSELIATLHKFLQDA